jgi:hypothetical protein
VIRVSEPMVTLNSRGRLVFNVAATKLFHEAGVDMVYLMWDAEAHKFAIRGTTKKDSRAYALRYSSGNKWAAISAKSFLSHIGHPPNKTIPYAATWDKDGLMLEVSTDSSQHAAREVEAAKEPKAMPAVQQLTFRGNGRMTRKDSVAQFLREHGPATRGEIMKSLNIPIGTAGYVLNDPKLFVSREGRWHLVG